MNKRKSQEENRVARVVVYVEAAVKPMEPVLVRIFLLVLLCRELARVLFDRR